MVTHAAERAGKLNRVPKVGYYDTDSIRLIETRSAIKIRLRRSAAAELESTQRQGRAWLPEFSGGDQT